MTLDAWRYADPARVAEIDEARHIDGCQGCMHLLYLWGVRVCAKNTGRTGRDVMWCEDHNKGVKHGDR